jgi:carbamoyl-phosphate synthase large subunit
MTRPVRVLVTGAGALLGQGILRSLRDGGRDVYLIAADPSPLSAGLYWADERHLIPFARDPAFLASLRGLLERTRADVLIPGTDVELLALAEQRPALEEELGCRVLVCSPEAVRIADDKYLTARFLEERGLPHARSCLAGDEARLVEEVGFPLVVKPRIGARSVGVRLVQDARALARALEEHEGVAGPEGLVIQEAVGSAAAEYTAGTVTFDGRCGAVIVMRRDLRDGNTFRAYVEQRPELVAQVRDLAEALGTHGPANFQFRLDGDQAKTFEVNARFSGTTPLRRLAGFDEVGLCLDYLLDGREVVQPEVRSLTILRHWSETVVLPGDLLEAP